MEINQYVGLVGISAVREIVEMIKPSLPEKGKGLLVVITSLVVAILLNLALSMMSDHNFGKAIAVGLLTGFGSNIFNEVKKSVK